jgi:glycosyltransferase involved in cell wall biosynthesis
MRIFRHDKNRGIAQSLNTGFEHATGDYLTFTSDDNYYAPQTIERMLSFLLRRKADFVYCDYYAFKEDDESALSIVKLPEVAVDARNVRNNVGPCFLYSRRLKDAVGDFDPQTFLSEDYDYWVRASKKFPMLHLAEPLYYYRVHPESLSQSRRYEEIRTVGVLVGLKNRAIEPKRARSLLLDIASTTYTYPFNTMRGHGKIFGVNRILVAIINWKKLTKVVNEFMLDPDITHTKTILLDMMRGREPETARFILRLQHRLVSRLAAIVRALRL